MWGVATVSVRQASLEPANLEGYADLSGLRFSRTKGNLGALLRLDYPAILELSLPEGKGMRYVTLIGREGALLVIAPSTTISSSELEKYWSGRSYLPWKNVQNLPLVSRVGDSGESVRSLKILLLKAGYYQGAPTMEFDEEMLASVKHFQTAQGLEPDGVIGGRTLLLLYRAGGAVQAPRLDVKGES
jgi:general secretion pathway protein A